MSTPLWASALQSSTTRTSEVVLRVVRLLRGAPGGGDSGPAAPVAAVPLAFDASGAASSAQPASPFKTPEDRPRGVPDLKLVPLRANGTRRRGSSDEDDEEDDEEDPSQWKPDLRDPEEFNDRVFVRGRTRRSKGENNYEQPPPALPKPGH